MRVEVYTALLGALAPGTLPPPVPGADRYLCITDNQQLVNLGWDVVLAPTLDARRAARFAKTHPHRFCPDAAVSVWIDGSFTLKQSPTTLVATAAALNTDIVAFSHPDRHRMVDEAAIVARLKLADPATVQQQVQAYTAEGFDTESAPIHHLTTTGLLIRWLTPAVHTFNALWHEQLQRFTLRDQLSVDYCAWKLGLTIGYLDGHYRDNPYVQYHRNRRIPKR